MFGSFPGLYPLDGSGSPPGCDYQKCSQALLGGPPNRLPFENLWFILLLMHAFIKWTKTFKGFCVPNTVTEDTAKPSRPGPCFRGADILSRGKTVNIYKQISKGNVREWEYERNMKEKGVQGKGVTFDQGGLRGGLRRCIWTGMQMWRRRQEWEDPQEGSSGKRNSKCKGPEVRYLSYSFISALVIGLSTSFICKQYIYMQGNYKTFCFSVAGSFGGWWSPRWEGLIKYSKKIR